jgi:hypothetical protein
MSPQRVNRQQKTCASLPSRFPAPALKTGRFFDGSPLLQHRSRFDRPEQTEGRGTGDGPEAGVSGTFDPIEDGASLTLQGDAVAAAPLAGGDDDAVDDLP